jgi:hypothetical protein
MTLRDVGDSLATQSFDDDSVVIAPKTPDSSKISQVSTPQSRDYYPLNSPCSFEKSSPGLNLPADSMTEPPNPMSSKLSSIDEAILDNDDFSKRLFNGSGVSDPYCAVVDTAMLPTVVKTEPSSPNPPQCAYRAHNETDPSKSLTYLNSIQHPVLIKLEDFPISPAAETVPTDEHCMTLKLYQVLKLNQNPWKLSLLRKNYLQLLMLTNVLRHLKSILWLAFNNPSECYRHCFLTTIAASKSP